jgi:hypothetical protein
MTQYVDEMQECKSEPTPMVPLLTDNDPTKLDVKRWTAVLWAVSCTWPVGPAPAFHLPYQPGGLRAVSFCHGRRWESPT